MSRLLRILLLILISIGIVFTVSGSGGTEERKTSGKREEKRSLPGRPFDLASNRSPIDVTSDSLEGDQKRNLYTFKGNVVARKEDIVLYANMVTIQYDPETKGVKTVVATGNVKIVQQDRRATGQKITFEQDGNKVVLEGDAVLREGDNVIRGERVTYYVDEERSVVEGGKGGRVNTTITPPKKE